MPLKKNLLIKLGIARSSIKKDMLHFMLPWFMLFCVALYFCAKDGFDGFRKTLWMVLKDPPSFFSLPAHVAAGMLMIVSGLTIMLISQATLRRYYSGTVIVKHDHKLITHGIYRFSRNPIYLGALIVFFALPLWSLSLRGFLFMLLIIPLILNRIKMEEKLLSEAFGEAYQEYKNSTKRLIPYIY